MASRGSLITRSLLGVVILACGSMPALAQDAPPEALLIVGASLQDGAMVGASWRPSLLGVRGTVQVPMRSTGVSGDVLVGRTIYGVVGGSWQNRQSLWNGERYGIRNERAVFAGLGAQLSMEGLEEDAPVALFVEGGRRWFDRTLYPLQAATILQQGSGWAVRVFVRVR
jgi:hypothetical protein